MHGSIFMHEYLGVKYHYAIQCTVKRSALILHATEDRLGNWLLAHQTIHSQHTRVCQSALIVIITPENRHGHRKMFSLIGAGQNLLDAKVTCSPIDCPHRAKFIGAAAPIAPMVHMPITGIGKNVIYTLLNNYCGCPPIIVTLFRVCNN